MSVMEKVMVFIFILLFLSSPFIFAFLLDNVFLALIISLGVFLIIGVVDGLYNTSVNRYKVNEERYPTTEDDIYFIYNKPISDMGMDFFTDAEIELKENANIISENKLDKVHKYRVVINTKQLNNYIKNCRERLWYYRLKDRYLEINYTDDLVKKHIGKDKIEIDKDTFEATIIHREIRVPILTRIKDTVVSYMKFIILIIAALIFFFFRGYTI